MDKINKQSKAAPVDLEKEEIERFMYMAELARSDNKFLDAITNLQHAERIANLAQTQRYLALKTREEIRQQRMRIDKELRMERQKQEQLKAEQEAKQKKQEEIEAKKKQADTIVTRGVKNGAKLALGTTAAAVALPVVATAAAALHKKSMAVSASTVAHGLKHRLASAGLIAAGVLLTRPVMNKLRTRFGTAKPQLKNGLARLHAFGTRVSSQMVQMVRPILSALGI